MGCAAAPRQTRGGRLREDIAGRVLLVPSSEAAETDLLAQLRAAGFRVTPARLDAATLSLLTREEIDVVLLLDSAPPQAGAEFVRACRADRVGAGLPILALSGSESARLEGVEVGLPIPGDSAEWTMQLRAWVRLGRSQRARLAAERERDELRHRLVQAHKLETVGRLAGGIGHDFNNLLTSIICFTRFVVDDMALEDPRRGDLVEVLRSADQAARLSNQLLLFARRRPAQSATLDTNAALVSLARVLRRTMGEGFDVVILPADHTAFVAFDAAQFDQLIFSLAINAKEAMPRGGTVTFKLGATQLASLEPQLAAGEYVELLVFDTGADVPPDAARPAPAHSIPPAGRGSGIGLATCKTLLAPAGGAISAVSAPGPGSCVRVLLPRVAAGRRSDPAPALPEPPRVVETATALVVEDQPGIKRMIARALGQAGLCVLEANSGEDALAVIEQYGRMPDLVVTEVVLPRMSGQRLVDRLREGVPTLKVLYVSGYIDDEVALIETDRNTAFVAKPFTGHELATRAVALLQTSVDPAAVGGE
jgi:two-component system cell cycle sensor histidine kinase/response regulator CckA